MEVASHWSLNAFFPSSIFILLTRVDVVHSQHLRIVHHHHHHVCGHVHLTAAQANLQQTASQSVVVLQQHALAQQTLGLAAGALQHSHVAVGRSIVQFLEDLRRSSQTRVTGREVHEHQLEIDVTFSAMAGQSAYTGAITTSSPTFAIIDRESMSPPAHTVRRLITSQRTFTGCSPMAVAQPVVEKGLCENTATSLSGRCSGP